jgi:hypothetical protein
MKSIRVAPWGCEECGGPVVTAVKAGPFPRRCQNCPKKKPAADRSRYFRLAHAYVSTAIYNGDLPKLDGSVPCTDCGGAAVEYDHRDYKRPMEVEPVCKSCNQLRGPGLHRDPSETAEKPPSILRRFRERERAA